MAIYRIFYLRRNKKIAITVCVSMLLAYTCLQYLHDDGIGNAELLHGTLNVDIWRGLCGFQPTDLKQWWFFPLFPDESLKKSVDKFDIEDNTEDYGQRIFGFLRPPSSGIYRFAIASDDTSELWLSQSKDSKKTQLIAWVFDQDESTFTAKNKLDQYPGQVSKGIELRKGSNYHIEVIHKQGVGVGFVQVWWMKPKETKFTLIGGEHLSSYDNRHFKSKPDALQSWFSGGLNDSFKKRYIASRAEFVNFYSLPFIPKENYLSKCDYKSSLVLSGTIDKYEGVKVATIHQSSVYPPDDTAMGTLNLTQNWANRIADQKTIQTVANKITSSLRLKTSKNYFLKRIHKVIQNSDPIYGDRFSIDLELGLNSTNQSFRLSEHVYNQKMSDVLCFPEGIDWNNKATVYFIIPVKDQGKWIYHFIKEITTVSLVTGDTNFHVIVVDFESKDIDMVKAFNTSLLRNRHTLVSMEGKFYKTLALNTAVELVPSTHDLLFLFDLHIDVPIDILDSVRKNTIEGKIVYSPVVGRLNCGSTSVDHRGYWEMEGFGLIGIYKSDWIRIGGMNVKDYQYKWGGEDWDLLDRVLMAGLEVQRIKHPGLYHHFHTKRKSW